MHLQLRVVCFPIEMVPLIFLQLLSRGLKTGALVIYLLHCCRPPTRILRTFLLPLLLLLHRSLRKWLSFGRVLGGRGALLASGVLVLQTAQFGPQLFVLLLQPGVFAYFIIDISPQTREVLADVQQGTIHEYVFVVYFEPALGAAEGSALLDEGEALLAVGVLPPADDLGFAGGRVEGVGADGAGEVEPFLQLPDDDVVGVRFYLRLFG